MPMKTCFKCGQAKPLDDFYAHPRMADGHLNKCKECTKSDASKDYRRKVSAPAGLEAERARGRDKYARLYRVGPNWQSPEAPHDVKMRARNALANAVRDGKVVKPKACEDCGVRDCRIHGHHLDYYRPLMVTWLCPRCHRRRHAVYPERVRTA